MNLTSCDDERTRTAYHEAGHVVIAWLEGLVIESATIKPSEDFRGSTRRENPAFGKFEPSLEDCRSNIRCYLAGVEAADLAGFEDFEDGAEDDYREVGDYLIRLPFGDHDSEPYRLEVRSMLQDHWSKVEALAEALLEEETLSADRIRSLLKGPGK